MDLLNETVLLKTKRTLFNLLVKETSQFLCYERLLNMTNVAYKKCIFQRNAILVALLYSGFISSTILTISIKNFSRIPFGCKKCVFLHDTRLWFPDYKGISFNGLLGIGTLSQNLLFALLKLIADGWVSKFTSLDHQYSGKTELYLILKFILITILFDVSIEIDMVVEFVCTSGFNCIDELSNEYLEAVWIELPPPPHPKD